MRNRRMFLSLCCVFVCFLLNGCASNENPQGHGINVLDSNENTIELAEKPQRVIALSASLADLWLLSGGEVVGASADTFTERDLGYDLSEVENVGTISEPNSEIIMSLQPDLVICSADLSAHQKLAETLSQAGIPCYAGRIDTFDEYLAVLEDFTNLTDHPEKYTEFGLQQQEEIQKLLDEIPTGQEKRVLFLRASSSKVSTKATGHVVCDILDEAGAINIAAQREGLLENLSLEAIVAENPDYIFLVTMGGNEAAAMQYLEETFSTNPVWSELQAVKNDRFIILPREMYQYKPNAKWSEAYAYLLEILYAQN